MTRRGLVAGLAALGGALIIATAIGWLGFGLPFTHFVDSYTLTNLVIGTSMIGCGALVGWNRPENAIGWLFLVGGVGHLLTSAAAAPLYLGIRDGWAPALTRTLSTVFTASWQLGLPTLFFLAVLLFPTGHLISRRWLPLAWLLVANTVWQIGTGVLSDGSPLESPAAASILSIGLELPAEVDAIAGLINAVMVLAVVASVIVRFRRGSEMEKRQIFWLLLVLIIMLVLNSQRWITGDGPILPLLSFILVPIAITIAVLRYQLLDIRLVISRTLLYLVASIVVIAVYAGVVAALSLWLPTGTDRLVAIAAALVVAFAFAPLRAVLQRIVDRAFYGSRADPVVAATRFSEGLRLSDDVAAVLETMRSELRLPSLALERNDTVVAAVGASAPERSERLALEYDGHVIGTLTVGLRSGDRVLHDTDRQVFSLTTPSLALALHTAELVEQLRESRAAIVAAREEERQRLHRDLHDGLGPVLSGAVFRADAADNTIERDPAVARQLLAGVRAEIRQALDSVRRVVYGIRPLDLEESGLVGSLQARAAELRGRDGAPIAVSVSATGALDELSAATQLAAYRIVVEALTNTARHSDARTATVELAALDDLWIAVTDPGDGTESAWVAGAGMASIIARAEELGGTASIGRTPSGWSVEARLPLGVRDGAE